MESSDAITLLSALAHPGRIAVVRLLMRHFPRGVAAGEIAAALDLKPNTASQHLGHLERTGLIAAARDGRRVLYSARPARMGGLIDYLAADCCRGRPDLCTALATTGAGAMAHAPYNVLFICSGNSARSIIAEAILAREGAGRFVAHSAGIRPRSELNPHAVEMLRRAGYGTDDLHAKHISRFQTAQAPRMDFVFTVCDTAANEECPPWPGQPLSGHWGLPDPARVEGTEAEKALAFARTFDALRRRIASFVSLPLDQLDRVAIQSRLDTISDDTATA
ncbi:ArsR family transcriptional regulator [Rhodobacteraceae bacterium CCMM004]|nr:ArsR family transcriptional regulator [Rhodobacteraceae bacterium CCMM004]